ncbi:MAG: hypothetical protein WAS07_13870 [Micropruina sp.]
MNKRIRVAGAGVALALTATFGLLPAATAHAVTVVQAQPAATSLPVTGTDFVGQLSNLTVSAVDGALQLTGTITGMLDGLPITDTFTSVIDVAQVNDACTILDLDLGPLHLDVLGLVVDLDEVHLDITAVPGAGNLLGNLLCAVAGLLDRDGPLTGISALLNRLLTGLGL